MVASLAEEGIYTSTICLGYNTSSNIEELSHVCEAGLGKAFATDSASTFEMALFDLLNLKINYQTDENGDFVFNENGEPILIDSVIQDEEFDNRKRKE